MVTDRYRVLIIPPLLALLTLLSPVIQADNSRKNPTSDWMPNDLDWDKARAFRILIEEGTPPTTLTLTIDEPYRLIFDNRSKEQIHEITNLEFFHAVVLERMTISGGNLVTPHIHNLKVQPRSKVELFLSPKIAGRFEIYCSIDSHLHSGPITTVEIK